MSKIEEDVVAAFLARMSEAEGISQKTLEQLGKLLRQGRVPKAEELMEAFSLTDDETGE